MIIKKNWRTHRTWKGVRNIFSVVKSVFWSDVWMLSMFGSETRQETRQGKVRGETKHVTNVIKKYV